MAQLILRKNEALLAVGGLLVAGGGLLVSVLPTPYSYGIGGAVTVVGLALVAWGTFGLSTSGRILNQWNADILYRALRATGSRSTIRILQTSIPDATKLIGVLEEVLIQKKNPLRLHLLLLDHEKADAVITARMQLRLEEADTHKQEVKTNIDQFIKLKERVDAAWLEPLSGAKLDLQIRLYTFLPFGSVIQIGQERIISGLFWNWTSSINGPMIVVTDRRSKPWECYEKQFIEGWKSARSVYPELDPKQAGQIPAKAGSTG